MFTCRLRDSSYEAQLLMNYWLHILTQVRLTDYWMIHSVVPNLKSSG